MTTKSSAPLVIERIPPVYDRQGKRVSYGCIVRVVPLPRERAAAYWRAIHAMANHGAKARPRPAPDLPDLPCT